MKRIVITGINGVIGSELKKRFIEKGYYIVGIGRTSFKEKEEDRRQFKHVKLDITDQDRMKQFFANIYFEKGKRNWLLFVIKKLPVPFLLISHLHK